MSSYEQFSKANLNRCQSTHGFNHSLSSWSASDWLVALLGELGEAANVIKKIKRAQEGVRGNKESLETLYLKLEEELGDTFVYFDLLCQSLGHNAFELGVKAFNRKSVELDYPVTLPHELPEA